MVTQTQRSWHASEADKVLAALSSGREGLVDEVVQERLAEYGPNSLPQAKSIHPLLRFLSQFNIPLIYFLLAAAAAAFVLDHAIDAVVILLVVLVNAVVGFVQEGRAEKELSGMRRLISPRAYVIRSGEKREVDATCLVPGDIVLIEPGDRVPADLRILRARGLAIEEAALTGESVASEKQEAPVAEDAALGDRSSMASKVRLSRRAEQSGLIAVGPKSRSAA